MREHVKKTSSLPPSADGFVPTWSCSRRGLPGHPHYCRCRWSFTPPFHHHPPSPQPLSQWERGTGVRGLSVSVALIRQVSSSRRVPRPGCYPTPCSMECGLSSTRRFPPRPRPPGRPERLMIHRIGEDVNLRFPVLYNYFAHKPPVSVSQSAIRSTTPGILLSEISTCRVGRMDSPTRRRISSRSSTKDRRSLY